MLEILVLIIFLDMLMPFLEAFLQKLMEGCATTEQRAVDMLTRPRPWQVERTEGRAQRSFRRCPDFKRLRRQEQEQTVNDIMSDVYDASVAEPEKVVSAWRSVNQSA